MSTNSQRGEALEDYLQENSMVEMPVEPSNDTCTLEDGEILELRKTICHRMTSEMILLKEIQEERKETSLTKHEHIRMLNDKIELYEQVIVDACDE